MNRSTNILLAAIMLLAATWFNPIQAQQVPAKLPDPDGKSGSAKKPVKVYILAGQSNMVGMGNISGAKNMYSGVYYSSDPNIVDGAFQIYRVGNYKASRLKVFAAAGKATEQPTAKGQLEAPGNGVYRVHCGFGENSYVKMQLAGKEVYRRKQGEQPVLQDIELQAGKRYDFAISGFKGKAPRFWIEKTDLLGNGDLEAVVKRDGLFPWLVDDQGNWTTRKDVYFHEARLAKNGKGSWLSATSNGRTIGPELGFGHVLGTFHDEQVLLIKTAQGNRSLGFDFRPPSSGRNDPNNQFEGAEYRLMVEGVRKTLDQIKQLVPDYQGQGYELAGFVWFQGHKDSFSKDLIENYEKNLVNMIEDVRKEFGVPKLPAVVATVGFGGHRMQEKFRQIHLAQMAVGDPKKHPEYRGNVKSVDTRDFWREIDESPKGEDYHYNRNAETYLRIGDAIGRAMVALQGGKAAELPNPKRSESSAVQTGTPTDAEKALSQKALKPIILDGVIESYLSNPRYRPSLIQEASGQRPKRANQFLRGAMYGLINAYDAAGIHAYDWKRFGPDLDEATWEYFSFDPAETQATDKPNRYRKVTWPEGMDNWFSPDFDAGKAGWKRGLQPFGQLDGKKAPLRESCTSLICRCGETPKTLWEKEVLMLRTQVKIPPFKKGHRYRVVIGGAAHVNSGEGFAIYVNGKLLAESKSGVPNRQGGQPRGGHVYQDLLKEFQGQEVTLAAISFLRLHHPRAKPFPPRGHLTLRIEEQKIPPSLEGLASEK